jgi:hypothetical protein
MPGSPGILALRASAAFRCLESRCPLGCHRALAIRREANVESTLSRANLSAIEQAPASTTEGKRPNPDDASFPFVFQRGPNGLEYGISPACPEHTRLLLETADGDHAVYLRGSELPDIESTVRDEPAMALPWGRSLEIVRSTLTALLTDESLSCEFRLLAAASFARESGDFFRPNAGTRIRRELDKCVRRHLALAQRRSLARTLEQTTRQPLPILRVLRELCVELFNSNCNDEPATYAPEALLKQHLVAATLPHLGLRGSGTPVIEWEPVRFAYENARRIHHEVYGARLEQSLIAIARDYVFSRRFFADANLHTYFQRLLVELSLLRWLIRAYLLSLPPQQTLAPIVAQFVALIHRQVIAAPAYEQRVAGILVRRDLASFIGSAQLVLF